MNREDIIELAKQAGGTEMQPYDYGAKSDRLIMRYEVIERFAALVAAAERQKSIRLWMLLDDIDTADDIARADDKLYRSICQRHQKKRWEILSEEEVDAAIRAKEKNT